MSSKQVKPNAWGNQSDVQSALFHNAEQMGIDPDNIVFANPCWNPGAPVDYSKSGGIGTNNGSEYRKNSSYFFNTYSNLNASASKFDGLTNGTVLIGVNSSQNQVSTMINATIADVNTERKYSYLSCVGPYTGTYGDESFTFTYVDGTTGLNFYERSGHYRYLDGLDHHMITSINGYDNCMAVDGKIKTLFFKTGSKTTSHFTDYTTTPNNLVLGRREIKAGGTTYQDLHYAGSILYLTVLGVGVSPERAAELSDNPYQLWQPPKMHPIFRLLLDSSAGDSTYTLETAVTAFTVTPQDAELNLTRKLTTAVTNYTVTPQDAILTADRLLTSSVTEYTLTPQDAILTADRLLTGAVTAYTVTPQDAELTYTPLGAYVLETAVTNFALTPQDADLLVARKLETAVTAYTVTPQDAELTYTPLGAYILTAAVTNFAITPQDAALSIARKLTTAVTNYSVTGQDANLQKGFYLTTAVTNYAVTPQDANFLLARKLTAGVTNYTVTGKSACLTYSGTEGLTFYGIFL